MQWCGAMVRVRVVWCTTSRNMIIAWCVVSDDGGGGGGSDDVCHDTWRSDGMLRILGNCGVVMVLMCLV